MTDWRGSEHSYLILKKKHVESKEEENGKYTAEIQARQVWHSVISTVQTYHGVKVRGRPGSLKQRWRWTSVTTGESPWDPQPQDKEAPACCVQTGREADIIKNTWKIHQWNICWHLPQTWEFWKKWGCGPAIHFLSCLSLGNQLQQNLRCVCVCVCFMIAFFYDSQFFFPEITKNWTTLWLNDLFNRGCSQCPKKKIFNKTIRFQ